MEDITIGEQDSPNPCDEVRFNGLYFEASLNLSHISMKNRSLHDTIIISTDTSRLENTKITRT